VKGGGGGWRREGDGGVAGGGGGTRKGSKQKKGGKKYRDTPNRGRIYELFRRVCIGEWGIGGVEVEGEESVLEKGRSPRMVGG
jgi:hypothetical protein